MEGRISLPEHMLTVGTQADVKADIDARTVIVKGAVTGNVTAAEVNSRFSPTVRSWVMISPRLVIAEGGSLQGRVEHAGQVAAAASITSSLANTSYCPP